MINNERNATVEYIAYLHKDRDSDYGVSFPDFPGCVTAGKSLEDARQMAAEALKLHIRGMMKDGDEVPEPSTLDDLADDPCLDTAVAFLVRAEAAERTVRINITARESQLLEIDRLASEAGMTRSSYIVHKALPRKTAASSRKSGKRSLAKKLERTA